MGRHPFPQSPSAERPRRRCSNSGAVSSYFPMKNGRVAQSRLGGTRTICTPDLRCAAAVGRRNSGCRSLIGFAQRGVPGRYPVIAIQARTDKRRTFGDFALRIRVRIVWIEEDPPETSWSRAARLRKGSTEDSRSSQAVLASSSWSVALECVTSRSVRQKQPVHFMWRQPSIRESLLDKGIGRINHAITAAAPAPTHIEPTVTAR